MPTPPDLVFAPFRLALADAQLRKGDHTVPLRPKAFAVLRYLAERHGQLATKDEIVAHVWEGAAIASGGLKVLIGELREALDDEPTAPRFIETVPRRGYRFIAPVTRALGTAPFPAGAASQPPPAAPAFLVGREPELDQLTGALARARAGARQVIYVTGDAGTGKTTLVEAFLARAGADGELWIGEGRCVEHYGSGEAYLPFLEAVSRLCRGSGRDLVPALLRRYAPTWLVQLPWLLDAGEREMLVREVQGVAQERMLREMADALEALTTEVPLVLTLEDLHWSDYSTLDLLSLLTRRPGAARLMIVATFRPIDAIVNEHPVKQLKQDLTLRGLSTEIALEVFTHDEVAAYLAHRFPPLPAPPTLVTNVHRATDGHPLFLSAVADDLVAEGMVVPNGNGDAVPAWRWQAEAGVTLGVPATIRQLLERQIERLDAADRQVLEVASAIGATFTSAAVAAALDDDSERIEERCEAFARRGQLLRSMGVADGPDGAPTGRYGFTHALHQRTLHDAIAAGRRSRLHALLGERLEAAYGSRADTIAAELAAHFEEGRDHPRAIRYRQLAAANASRRSATREAVDHLQRAEALLPELADEGARLEAELAIQMALGPALMSTSGYAAPEVEHAFTRARAISQALGDPAALFPVLWGIWGYHVVRGEMTPARALAAQCLALAEEVGDPAWLVEGHHALWVTSFFCGELAAALSHVESGLALYRPEHRAHVFLYGQDPEVVAHSYGAMISWFMGRPEAARRHSEDALTLGKAVGHPFSLGFAMNFATWVHYCRGDAERTRVDAEHLITLATDQGFPFWLAGATHFAAWAMVDLGEIDAGIARMRAGLEGWRATGAGLGLPSHLGRLIEAHLAAEDPTAAAATLAEALAFNERSDQRYYEAELHRLRGVLLLRHPELAASPTDADEALVRAVAVATAQGSTWLACRAATTLAGLRRDQGRPAEARRLLEPIIAGLDADDTSRDAAAARALHAALPSRRK